MSGKRRGPVRGAFRALFQASVNFDRDHGFDQAATISYFALLSLLPLVILLVAFGAALIGSVDAAEQGARLLLRDLVRRVGPDAFARAREVGSQARELEWPFLLLALWTASKVFSKVEAALDLIFQVEKRRSYPARKVFAFGLVALLALTLVALVVGESALRAFNRFLSSTALLEAVRSNQLYLRLNSAASRLFFPWLVAAFTFSFIYKVVPACAVPWRAASVAGVVAGSLWEGLKHAFTLYVGRFADYGRTYGALEAVVVFAIWVNLSGSLLIWGGELAAVLAGARGREPSAEVVSRGAGDSGP